MVLDAVEFVVFGSVQARSPPGGSLPLAENGGGRRLFRAAQG